MLTGAHSRLIQGRWLHDATQNKKEDHMGKSK
jgi:hypothetical protein